MDLQKFLKRIKFNGEPRINLETLAKLQELFMLNVVFENLDIHYGPVLMDADPEKAYHKVVNQGRGGFCYELNGLFAAMLRKIGFQVDLLSCFLIGDPRPDTDFSHMLLRVSLNYDYIVDVGNGRSFRTPLRADGSNESRLPEGFVYRIGTHIEGPTLYLKKDGDSAWTTRYHFNPVPREYSQYNSRAIYYQTEPGSYFTKHPLLTQALPNGRITLTDVSLTINEMGVDTETPVPDEKTFMKLLKSKFKYPVNLLPKTRQIFPKV